MPSAKIVADAARRWADAGLPSPGSSRLQAVGREAKRAGEVTKYLSGLDPLGKACAAARTTTHNNPSPKPAKNVFLELFAGNVHLGGAVLVKKLDVGAHLKAAHGDTFDLRCERVLRQVLLPIFGRIKFGGFIWRHPSPRDMFTSPRACPNFVP